MGSSVRRKAYEIGRILFKNKTKLNLTFVTFTRTWSRAHPGLERVQKVTFYSFLGQWLGSPLPETCPFSWITLDNNPDTQTRNLRVSISGFFPLMNTISLPPLPHIWYPNVLVIFILNTYLFFLWIEATNSFWPFVILNIPPHLPVYSARYCPVI